MVFVRSILHADSELAGRASIEFWTTIRISYLLELPAAGAFRISAENMIRPHCIQHPPEGTADYFP
jgi:hypothetical protein